MNRMVVLKFIGDVMQKPEQFKSLIDIEGIADDGVTITGQFKARGSLATFLREAGINVKRSVEAGNKIEAQGAAETSQPAAG